MQRLNHRQPSRAAFTLVEVVAAVAILALVTAGTLVARAGAMRAARLADEIITTTRLCANQAALLRAQHLPTAEGDFLDDPGYHWTVTSAQTPDAGLAAYTVRVDAPSRQAEAAAQAVVWLPVAKPKEQTP